MLSAPRKVEYKGVWPEGIIPLTLEDQKPHDEIKKVLITGITGQDGLYLTAYLLFHQDTYDYQVHGFVRKNSGGLYMLEQI